MIFWYPREAVPVRWIYWRDCFGNVQSTMLRGIPLPENKPIREDAWSVPIAEQHLEYALRDFLIYLAALIIHAGFAWICAKKIAPHIL